MATQALHSEAFRRSVIQPLSRLGSTLRRHVIIGGLCRCLAWAVGLTAVQFALDRSLGLGVGPRAALLLIVLAVLTRQTWTYVVRPAGKRLDYEMLAALLERRDARFRDRLISAASFFQRSIGPHDSPALLERLAAEIVELSGPLRPESVLCTKRYHRLLLLGAFSAGIVAAFAWRYPQTWNVFLSRDLFLRDTAWPSNTMLVPQGFVDGKLRWPRGDELTILAVARGDLPSGVQMESRFASYRVVRQDMARRGDDQFLLEMGPLVESMRLRFWIDQFGADLPTDWYEVEAVERPRVQRATLEVRPPAYTELGPFTLPLGQISCDLLRGSEVHVEVEVNKPVAVATWRMGEAAVVEAEPVAERRFRANFAPVQSGTYSLDLADAEGLHDPRPLSYALRLQGDPPPRVRLALPGVGDMIVPGAALEAEVECEDNLALRSVSLVSRLLRGEAERARVTTKTHTLPDFVARQARYQGRESVATLWLGIQPGDRLQLLARARDYQTADSTSQPASVASATTSLDPGVSESTAYTLRVVSAEELLAELGRRENEWRREFEQIIKAQEQLAERLSVLSKSSTDEAAGREAVQGYAREERLQRQQIARMKTVRGQFAAILTELRINMLAGGTVRRRLEGGILRPLGRLIESDVPAAAEVMEQLAGRPDGEQAADLGRMQERIIQSMYAILANMQQLEGYNEAVALLRDIVRLQGEVNQQTQARLDEEIRRLFGAPPSSQPGSEP